METTKMTFSDGEWIEKMWYLYIMGQYSAVKKNEIVNIADKGKGDKKRSYWVHPKDLEH